MLLRRGCREDEKSAFGSVVQVQETGDKFVESKSGRDND